MANPSIFDIHSAQESEELKKALSEQQDAVERLTANQEMNENITREKVQQVGSIRPVYCIRNALYKEQAFK